MACYLYWKAGTIRCNVPDSHQYQCHRSDLLDAVDKEFGICNCGRVGDRYLPEVVSLVNVGDFEDAGRGLR